MLHAFYLALFCQCLLYEMRDVYNEVGTILATLMPLRLLINAIVCKTVDAAALDEVVDHFAETVQLRICRRMAKASAMSTRQSWPRTQ